VCRLNLLKVELTPCNHVTVAFNQNNRIVTCNYQRPKTVLPTQFLQREPTKNITKVNCWRLGGIPELHMKSVSINANIAVTRKTFHTPKSQKQCC